MVLRYLIIQMAETSASGFGGDTESEPRSSCRGLGLDLGNLPFEHQAPIDPRDDHILIRPLQDPRLNRISPRIARIQNAVNTAPLRESGTRIYITDITFNYMQPCQSARIPNQVCVNALQ